MDPLYIVRGRTVSVRTKTLALEAQKRALRLGLIPDPKTTVLFLRFMPFETQLLNALAHHFIPQETIKIVEGRNDLDGFVAKLFFKWQWASDVMHQVLTDLHPEEVEEDHKGDQVEAFEMVQTMLQMAKNGDLFDYRHQRTARFVSDNRSFVEKLGSIDVESIGFYPHPEDTELWRLLAFMFVDEIHTISNWAGFGEDFVSDSDDDDWRDETDELDEPQQNPMENSRTHLNRQNSQGQQEVDGNNVMQPHLQDSKLDASILSGTNFNDAEFPSSDDHSLNPLMTRAEIVEANASREVDVLLGLEDTWTVWQFSHMFWLLKSRPKNDCGLEDFKRLSCFRDHWKVAEVFTGDEDRSLFRGYFSQQELNGGMLHEIAESFREERFANHVTLKYQKLKHHRSLLDPSYYLQYIPHDELDFIYDESLIKDFHLLLGLEPPANYESSFVLWTPIKSVPGINSYYFNEDLFAHELDGDFTYPSFGVSDRILYKRTRVEASSLCSDMRYYWYRWNDIKLTRDEESRAFYILETLPGIKIRQLSATFDREAAHSFLSTLLRHQQSGLAYQESQMRNLLGPDYDPSYQYTLLYVDPAHLSNGEPTLVGEGSFGKVYKCFWQEKPASWGKIGALEPGFVALKVPTGRKNKDQKTNAKFFKELRLAHSALTGENAGFIKFFGFTQVFMDATGRISCDNDQAGLAVFALIFEFATEGTVLDHLQNQLTPSRLRWNWLQVCSALESIARGLELLHKRGILHRDIHPNNILVTKESFSNTSEEHYSCVISDIGEGKSIIFNTETRKFGSTHTDRRFGLKEYEAPEVPTLGHSWMSDMYAFGQLCIDIIRFNSQFFLDSETGKLRVPEKMLRVLHSCLAYDHKVRCEAVLAAAILEDIIYDVRNETDMEFVEEGTLPQQFSCRELSSWDSLSC